MGKHYIDADGHVMEKDQELLEFLEEPFKSMPSRPRQLLPSLDRFHTPRVRERKPGTFDPTVAPERWLEFLDRTGIEYTVLYPTDGLAYRQVIFPEWAQAYARIYNNWLCEKYLTFSPRFKGMALIPMQDVPSALAEVNRVSKNWAWSAL